jgi:hypothetical protein
MVKPLLGLCLLLAACTTPQPTGITSSTLSCPPDSTLTYETFGSTFMTDNCLSCHKTDERPALVTQAQVKANATKILQEAVYTTSMPEDTDMTTQERELLGEWLKCGAP